MLVIPQRCEEAAAQAARFLEEAGLLIIRTLAVLLAYGQNGDAIVLVVHGDNADTWFSLIDVPQQPADSKLEETIIQPLRPNISP